MSWPWLRSDQIVAEVAVASGGQGRKACGETPSTLAPCPLTVTLPPSTGSTAATPPSLRILASWAGVIPPGTAAMRSGTNCCRGAAELAGPGGGPGGGPRPRQGSRRDVRGRGTAGRRHHRRVSGLDRGYGDAHGQHGRRQGNSAQGK